MGYTSLNLELCKVRHSCTIFLWDVQHILKDFIMLNKYTIRVTGTHYPLATFSVQKQLNFELEAVGPLEAFEVIERYVDDYDHVTIGCPRRKGVSAIHPYFVTGTAKVLDGIRRYDWTSV